MAFLLACSVPELSLLDDDLLQKETFNSCEINESSSPGFSSSCAITESGMRRLRLHFLFSFYGSEILYPNRKKGEN